MTESGLSARMGRRGGGESEMPGSANTAPSAEAPQPASRAPEGRDESKVEMLEGEYDRIVETAMQSAGRTSDAKLIKEAALAKKDSFVLTSMREQRSMGVLSRLVGELVNLSNQELADVINKMRPEGQPERVVEASEAKAAPAAETAPEPAKAEAEPPAATSKLEALSKVEGLKDEGGLNEDQLEGIVVEALGSAKTDWTKVETGFLEAVQKVLEDLKADKNMPAPEFPFLKMNRINKALEQVGSRIKVHRNIDGITSPEPVTSEMSPDEQVAQMMQQYESQGRQLDDLRNQLRDYLATAGIFGGRKKHARDLKSQISDLTNAQDNLMKVIDQSRGSSAPRSKITAGSDRAGAQAERAGRGPYNV